MKGGSERPLGREVEVDRSVPFYRFVSFISCSRMSYKIEDAHDYCPLSFRLYFSMHSVLIMLICTMIVLLFIQLINGP